MTNKELQLRLKTLPDEAEVVFYDSNWKDTEIESVSFDVKRISVTACAGELDTHHGPTIRIQ